MTRQKRKADAASPAESSDESPYKRARSESTDDTAHKQVGYSHFSNESPDRHTEHSIPVAKPSARLAPDNGSETAFQGDLPHTWDQASAADKILVDMKEENTRRTWARIEENWERSTGERPAEGILQDRYRRLKALRAHSEAGGAVGRKVRTKVVEESLKTSDDVSTLPTTKVRLSGRVTRGPLHKSSNAMTKRPITAAKPSNPANERKSDESSRPIPKDSKTAAKLPKTASAAPASEVTPELDLPQSWEQATAGDQLIVTMKTNRRGWARTENAWQKLTGKKPTEGALQDRYEHIKALIIRPGTNGAPKYRYPVKASSFDGASDQVVPRRAKPALRAPRKRKAEAEPSEESLDESSDQSLEESSDESSYGTSKRSITMARRKRRGAIEQRKRASASDRPLDERISNRTKTTAEEPSDGRAQSESSHASDEISKDSIMVARSAKRQRMIPAIAANSGTQNTAETANEMVVEMKERGCSWVEISKAWTERTGFTHAPETLRKRYARLKKGFATKINSTGQASSNRKVNVASPDEGSYDASAKRSKSTAETPRVTEFPVKRNMDRGKRKSSVKYTDSTTDEDEIFAAPAEPVATTTDPAKRNAGRAAKVNRSDPEWLVTNENSPLAYEDLHAEFSNFETYEDFTKSDWEDLRETLPPNVPINPDGFSIPMSFFKYDPDFRRGIREFQEDLASGRLDPKWQADAAQAMEERSQGAFDAYKESQFEAFWGQKQKLGRDALAGESTKIKLDLLIQNEIFKVGDYFSYSRVFGRGKNGVLVEKDCKIVKVDNKALTFAIPPGQRKYSRRMFESDTSKDTELEAKATTASGDEQLLANLDSRSDGAENGVTSETDGDEGPQVNEEGSAGVTTKETAESGYPPEINLKETEAILDSKAEEVGTGEPTQSESNEIESDTIPQEDETHEATASEGYKENGATVQINGGDQSTAAASQDEDVLHSISYLTQLENKIVDIDGRFKSKDMTAQNSWKNFRGIRNHQDLGTLFEMREEFYVYKHPRIVKEAKRKR